VLPYKYRVSHRPSVIFPIIPLWKFLTWLDTAIRDTCPSSRCKPLAHYPILIRRIEWCHNFIHDSIHTWLIVVSRYGWRKLNSGWCFDSLTLYGWLTINPPHHHQVLESILLEELRPLELLQK